MARTGTEFARISGSYKTHNIGTYQLSSQDVINNKSYFKLRDYFTYEGGTQVTSSYSTFKIDGNTVKSGSYSYTPGDHQLGTKDISVNHNNDGTFPGRSIELYVNSYHMSSTKSGKISSAPTIPRASSVTATEACVEAATTINIARASTNFKHTLKYLCGELTGTIVDKTSEVAYGWIIPTSFYEIMTGKEITCTIICETYNGTTKIGEKSTTFKVKVDEEKCKPEISATFKDVNTKTVDLTGNNQKLVKFISDIQVAITATGKNGATIVSKQVTCADGKSIDDNGIINSVESGKFTAIAVDSRTIESSEPYNLTMVDYIKLTCNATFYRPQPTTGEVAVKFDGNYFNGTFGKVTNTLKISYRYRKKGTETWNDWIELTKVINGNKYSNGSNPISLGTDFDYKEQYEFQIKANDKIYTAEEISSKCPVAAGKPLFDTGKDDISVNVVLNILNRLGEKKDILDVIDEIISERELERDKKKYHVGSMVLNMDGTNPDTYLGFGTWNLIAKESVLVGVNPNNEKFNKAGIVGGENEVKLTLNQIPSHEGHLEGNAGSVNGKGNAKAAWLGTKGITTNSDSVSYGWNYKNNEYYPHNVKRGGGQAHNNMQQYITCYIWQRTA